MTRHSIGSPPSAGQDAQTTENELGYDWGKNNLSLKGKVNPHSEKKRDTPTFLHKAFCKSA